MAAGWIWVFLSSAAVVVGGDARSGSWMDWDAFPVDGGPPLA